MTTKSDFSTEEWNQLLQSPFLAGLYVILSDLNITGMIKEMGALFKSVQEQPVPTEAQELVSALIADIKRESENNEQLPGSEEISKDDLGDVEGRVLESVEGVVVLVDSKATSDEAAGFMVWLFTVAKAVSDAAKEGGFLGMGGERVSDKEKTALKNLKSTLRI